MSKPRDPVEQAAAIALWRGRVCLVSSRSGKRWVVPKGCLERGKTVVEIVRQEAWEEAGLVGIVRAGPLGSYSYRKAGKKHIVAVFVMDVHQSVQEWPEKNRRERRWLPPHQAVSFLREAGLRRLLEAVVGQEAIGRRSGRARSVSPRSANDSTENQR